MIAKTTIGRSFKGCLAYNLAKVEQGQGEIVLSQGVREYDRGAMVADFTRQAKLHSELSRSVWHSAVSFSPQDEARLQQEPQLLRQVATDYLTGMGLDRSQYVVIRHRDTDHSHFHLVANRVREDGQVVSDSHNYSRSEKLLRQIEQKYGLTPMVEQSQRQSLKNVPERDRQRIELRDQVRACLKTATTGQELQQDLSQHGIRLIVNRDRSGQPRGVSFEQSSPDERGQIITTAFKGSKLHQNLSLAGITQQLNANQQEQQRQQAAAEAQKQAQELRTVQQQANTRQEKKSPENEQKRGVGRSL